MWNRSIQTSVGGFSRCALNKTMVVTWTARYNVGRISVDDFWMDREVAVANGSVENNSDDKEAEEGDEMPVAQAVEDGEEDRDDVQEVPVKKRKLNQTT